MNFRMDFSIFAINTFIEIALNLYIALGSIYILMTCI
jgi:hypothetical protein